MANIVIKEILASDTVSDLVDKVNFNFDQLLLNGGGPAGPIGIIGTQGPIGPRGVVWFTSGDLYNTSLTTAPDPPLVFPLWTGTPLKVNNISLPNYPQFKGDPNRYQPYATSTTGVYPDYSFIIGTSGKLPRSGDLYLQEGNDTYQSYSSTDGDVWEFNAVTNSWSFTGVNIKGATGGQGTAGSTEWVRENDNSINLNDYLRPAEVTGNNPIVRVVIGADSILAPDIITEGTQWTNNTLTLYQDVAGNGYQLAFTDSASIQAPTFSTVDYASIGSAGNKLFITGFEDITNTVNDRDINITARAGRVVLNATDPVINVTQSAYLDVINRNFVVQNGSLNISCAPGTAPIPGGNIGVEHTITDNTVALKIRHNQSATYGGWTSGNSIRMYTSAPGGSDMYLQDVSVNRLGVGIFNTNRASGKLSITSSLSALPSLTIGSNWGNTSTTFTALNQGTDTLKDSAFIEGMVVIGNNTTPNTTVYKLGSSVYNSINAASSVNIRGGILGFNSHISTVGASNFLSTSGLTSTGNYFIAPGSYLSSVSSGSLSDVNETLVIGGNSAIGGSLPGQYTTIWGTQKFRTGLAFKPTTSQVALNTQYFLANDAATAGANLTSFGSATIGRVKRYSTDIYVGHSQFVSNNNIILGFTTGTSTNPDPPRIVTNSSGNTITTSTANSIYLATPVFSGSMIFDQSDATHTATLTSRPSNSTYGQYSTYYPNTNAQTKIIHGISIVSNSSNPEQLTSTLNPYDTGSGLEIENFIFSMPLSSGGGTNINRSPVIKTGSGTYFKGSRPFLVSKTHVDGTKKSVILFEISPTNNVSVGKAFQFPDKAVYQGNNSRTSTGLIGTAFANLSYSSTQVTTSGNVGSWKDITASVPFIVPESNRSLHVNDIDFSEYTGDDLFKLDQNVGTVKSGIVINASVVTNTSGISLSLEASYKNYYNEIAGYKHKITTPVIRFNKTAPGIFVNIATTEPLGIKPGYVAYIPDTIGPFNPAKFIKGADVIIEGGDLIYSENTSSVDARPGDVFISPGVAYNSNGYQLGFSGAVFDLTRNYGSTYIGSRATNIGAQGYPANGALGSIVKTGLIYAGYDSGDSRSFEASGFKPKGNATLNVASGNSASAANRDSTEMLTGGKAINIQEGDIVTNNEDAGWIEFDLSQSALLTGSETPTLGGKQSNTVSCYVGNNSTTVAATCATSVTPSLVSDWKFYYKVIGYTVHFRLLMANLNFRTMSQVTGSTNNENLYSDFLQIANPNIFTGGGSIVGRIPKPKSDILDVNWNNNDDLGYFTTSSFNATGTLYLRNRLLGASRLSSFIMTANPGNDTVLLKKPVTMFYDTQFSRFYFRKTGGSAFGEQVLADITAPFMNSLFAGNAAYMAGNLGYANSLSRYLIDTNGQPFIGWSSTATYRWGSYMTYDLVVSGTYELDPTSWFV